MGHRQDLTGQTFGRLFVVGPAESTRPQERGWLCRCECGETKVVNTKDLRSGNTRSCGCLKREAQRRNGGSTRTHGGKGTRLYRIWRGMKSRCFNPNVKDYPRYGGRGIGICAEWVDNFPAFKAWALDSGYSETLAIDRIDNDGGYSPNNCRWIDARMQANNRRSNRRITFRGVTRGIREWAHVLGVSLYCLHDRLAKGMSVEDAFTTPVQERKHTGRRYVTMHGETHLLGDWSRRLGVARSSLGYILDHAPADAVFWRILSGGKPDYWRRRALEGDLLSELC